MEQNKPASIAVSAVKPVSSASPVGVAAVRPITPAASAPVRPVASKPLAEPAKSAVKKRRIKKASPASAVKKAAAKNALSAARKPAVARKAATSAKKPASSPKSFWGAGSAASSPFSSSAKTGRSEEASFLKMGTDVMGGLFGSDALKSVFCPLGGDTQKLSEKAFSFGKEGADRFAKTADTAARSLNDAVVIGQDNLEACVECGNVAAELSKAVGEEVFAFGNTLFSKNLDLSKQIFSCRTINDMFELQSKAFKLNIDNLFNETAKISEMTFKMASKAAGPLNDRAAEVTKHIKKTFSA